MEDDTKWCSSCQQYKPRSAFAKARGRYDGLQGRCKACQLAIREAHREEYRQYAAAYNDTHQEQIRQYRARTRPERAAYKREHYKENPGVYKRAQKTYQGSLKGRATSARILQRRRSRAESVANDLTGDQWKLILQLQRYKCLGCEIEFSDAVRPEVDHVMPVSKGGGLTFWNVQALCRRCNASKHDQYIDYRWWGNMTISEIENWAGIK